MLNTAIRTADGRPTGSLQTDISVAYFSDINERGGTQTVPHFYLSSIGFVGRKIKLLSCDDAYDPEKAVACFNSCLKDKVFIGAFFNGSPTIAKYVRMGETTGIPLVGFLNAPPAAYENRPRQFSIRPSYEREAEWQIRELWEKYNVRRFGFVYQADALGAAAREGLLAQLSKYKTVLAA